MASLGESFLHHLLPSLTLLYLFAAPYTKVEESFNVQATHDILTYGVPTSNITQFLTEHYDHVSFPGSVPRTFTGAVLLAGLSSPFTAFLKTPEQTQLIVRAILGLYNAFSLLAYRNAVTKVFGRTTGNWYLLLQASQFHVMYYASRTLPNMFAFGFTTLAMRSFLLAGQYSPGHAWHDRHIKLGVYAMTFVGVVFRSEVAILLATHVLFMLVSQQTSLARVIIPAGVMGAVVGLVVTVSVDSFFWQSFPLWPEWSGFYYNTILGKSSEWGVMPWHYYFSTAIPRSLLNPASVALGLVSLSIPATRSKTAMLVAPNVLFIGIYSLLPHKEWRFIVYSVPALTAAAAAGAAWIWNRRNKSPFYFVCAFLAAGSVLGAFVLAGLSVAISSLNYPGGAALVRLHELARQDATTSGVVKVHLDNLSCQTGVTRFLQMPDPSINIYQVIEPVHWQYDKTEDPKILLNALFWVDYDYALAEDPARVLGNWDVLDVIYGFDGVQLVKPTDPASAEDHMEIHLESGKDVEVQRAPHAYNAKWYKQFKAIEAFLRPKLRGNWISVKMAPKIWILKQQRGTPKVDKKLLDQLRFK